MGDEWVPTKVADLELGDEVRDFGVVIYRHSDPGGAGRFCVSFDRLLRPNHNHQWPSHATVDVRRPAVVTVEQMTLSPSFSVVRINGMNVGHLRQRHAECYAEKLRNRPDLRAEALGQS